LICPVPGFRYAASPSPLRRVRPVDEFYIAPDNAENVSAFVFPGVTLLQGPGNFSASKVYFLITDECKPLMGAGHPYLCFQFCHYYLFLVPFFPSDCFFPLYPL
jgi:hypothetical protein